jgi:hypothetical protein
LNLALERLRGKSFPNQKIQVIGQHLLQLLLGFFLIMKDDDAAG